jgi:23S rRNA (adenine-N6)-dimethyltransferase
VPAGVGRRWGWHRLDADWAQSLVAQASIRPGECVLDFGAGDGRVTAALADSGARVIAIELHPGRAAALRHRFADTNVWVVEMDALRFSLPGRPFRVVANPPFAITIALIRRLTARRSWMYRADLVLTRPVAVRIASRPPGGYLAETGLAIPARAVEPPPPKDAAVLVLRRRPGRRH